MEEIYEQRQERNEEMFALIPKGLTAYKFYKTLLLKPAPTSDDLEFIKWYELDTDPDYETYVGMYY